MEGDNFGVVTIFPIINGTTEDRVSRVPLRLEHRFDSLLQCQHQLQLRTYRSIVCPRYFRPPERVQNCPQFGCRRWQKRMSVGPLKYRYQLSLSKIQIKEASLLFDNNKPTN